MKTLALQYSPNGMIKLITDGKRFFVSMKHKTNSRLLERPTKEEAMKLFKETTK